MTYRPAPPQVKIQNIKIYDLSAWDQNMTGKRKNYECMKRNNKFRV